MSGGCWKFAILVLGAGLLSLRCFGAVAEPAGESATPVQVTLDYSHVEEPVAYASFTIRPTEKSFAKEPTPAGGSIQRAFLRFGDNPEPGLALIWDTAAGKLFLDLNSNGDFTDDTNGVFAARDKSAYYCSFPGIHLPAGRASPGREVLLDLSLYNPRHLSCSVGIRSFYSGKISLAGHEYQVGVVETLDSRGRHLLFRPWDSRSSAFRIGDGSLEAVPLLESLFFNGQYYDLACTERDQDGKPALQLALTPRRVPMGEVRISGKFVRRALMQGSAMVAVLDAPGESVQLPTGGYDRVEAALEADGVWAMRTGRRAGAQAIRVEASEPCLLSLGGPLTNSLSVTRSSEILRLDYELLGAGGDTYQLIRKRDNPEFRVVSGGKQVAAGQFEFG